jgi:hypothetical protein
MLSLGLVNQKRLRNGCGSSNLRRLQAITLPLSVFVCFHPLSLFLRMMPETNKHGVAPSDADFGMLHPILLSGWGTTIGELFDLDRLASECEKQKRWTFFLSSSPLNYTGVVASPPNIMAIL